MGKYEKKKKRRRRSNKMAIGIVCVLVIVIAAAAAVLLFGGAQDEKDPARQEAMPALVVNSVEQQDDTMLITTSYGVMKYPFAFSDLIQVEPVMGDDTAALEFFATINGARADLFAIRFGGEGEISLGSLELKENAMTVPVWAVMYEADPGLDENGMITFFAAQETFNDIASSLSENEGFTPAA